MYFLTGFLGLVSVVAPFVFGYSQDMTALWTSLIIGAVLIVASALEIITAGKEKWEYWVVGIAGVGAILAPFVLGFSTISTALWTLVIIGVITVLAAWTKLFPGQTQWR